MTSGMTTMTTLTTMNYGIGECLRRVCLFACRRSFVSSRVGCRRFFFAVDGGARFFNF